MPEPQVTLSIHVTTGPENIEHVLDAAANHGLCPESSVEIICASPASMLGLVDKNPPANDDTESEPAKKFPPIMEFASTAFLAGARAAGLSDAEQLPLDEWYAFTRQPETIDFARAVLDGASAPQAATADEQDFRAGLRHILNCHSKENGSNTPDFVLAEYLEACLSAFDKATSDRTAWQDEPTKHNSEASNEENEFRQLVASWLVTRCCPRISGRRGTTFTDAERDFELSAGWTGKQTLDLRQRLAAHLGLPHLASQMRARLPFSLIPEQTNGHQPTPTPTAQAEDYGA